MKHELTTAGKRARQHRPYNAQAEVVYAIMKLEEYFESNSIDDEIVGDYVLLDKANLEERMEKLREIVTTAFTMFNGTRNKKYKALGDALKLYNKIEEDEESDKSTET